MSDSLGAVSPAETQVIMTQLILPSHTNQLGTLFGGQLMAWIDMAASTAAMRHARSTVVTVSIGQMTFKRPVLQGHAVVLTARVDWVGKTSLEVGVKVVAENPLTGEHQMSNEAFLTFVAIDEQLKPKAVPPLRLETDEDRRAFEAARRRHEARVNPEG